MVVNDNLNNQIYLIPANSKKGKLIFNMFRKVDLVVFLSLTAISVLLLAIINSDSAIATIIKLTPVCIGFLLVMPVNSYHNVMVFFREMFMFLFNRRFYIWKGWCVKDEFCDENK